MSQFAFLQAEFPEVFEHAGKAETLALSDPRSACFHARLALEVSIKWMYARDRTLRTPYETTLSALIHEPTFRKLVGSAIISKARIIKDLGNVAVHETRAVPQANAITCVRELFHVCYWLVRTYARGAKPADSIAFSVDALPKTTQVGVTALKRLQEIEKRFEDEARARDRAEKEKLKSEGDRLTLEAEIKRLQHEISKVKEANQAKPDDHDYNEAQTRDAFIDLLLREAGWALDQERDTEFPVTGMPNAKGDGFVDYVLWGDDDKPLGLVEAKRTRRDPREGQRQAELYADCLEKQFGQRSVIFYSNGYEHWIWHDRRYPPRLVQGFLKKDELELIMQRRSTLKPLAPENINTKIDFCQNFEFFNQNPALAEGVSGASLGERLFAARVELIGEIDHHPGPDDTPLLMALRNEVAEGLREEVGAMNVDNFVVRPKRRLVEKYREAKIWQNLGLNERTELAEEVAGLPSSLIDEDIPAKQFDLLILNLQLALLRAEKSFDGYRKRVIEIAALLEELSNVPMVAAQLEFILEIQTDQFWRDVTAPMLETARRRLRELIKLIEITKRPHIYTDFEDEIGGPTEIEIQGVSVGADMHRFRMKVRYFLRDHRDHIAIQKVRRNEPLTQQDLGELERVFVEAGVAEPEQLENLRNQSGLGLFIRSLVGLDREAGKRAFEQFLAAKRHSGDQIEFVNMIIDHLTERGVMDPKLLYESPFTDFNSMGVEGVFPNADVVQLIEILEDVRRRAAA